VTERVQAALAALLMLALLASPHAVPLWAEPNQAGFTYEFTIHENGTVSLVARFTSDEPGRAWIMVPKFREYSLSKDGITSTSLQRDTAYYFYSNLTFQFEAGASLQMSYSYRFGSFIVEPNGVFFSTLVGYDPTYPGEVVVRMPASFEVEASFVDGREEDPSSKETSGGLLYLTFPIPPGSDSGHRVMVVFKTTEEPRLVNLTAGALTLTTPERYVDVAENVTEIYTRFQPAVSDVTDMPEIPISMRFFIPSDPEEIAVLGFTSVSSPALLMEDVITPGKVSLNLMLVRYPESYLPETLVHELLHQYMLRAGLSTELRWAHEGLAQYLSYLILRENGYPDAGQEDINLSRLVFQEVRNLGFLQDWRGGGSPPDPATYYLASLYVFSDLGERYGGLGFYKKFFQEIRADGAEVDEIDELVYYLSRAAGEDLSDYFSALGFNLPLRPVEVGDPLEVRASFVMTVLNGTRPLNPLAGQVRDLVEAAKGYRLAGDFSSAYRALDEALTLSILGPLIPLSILVAALTALFSLALRGQPRVDPEVREMEARLAAILFEEPVERWDLAVEVLRMSKKRGYEAALREALRRAELGYLGETRPRDPWS